MGRRIWVSMADVIMLNPNNWCWSCIPWNSGNDSGNTEAGILGTFYILSHGTQYSCHTTVLTRQGYGFPRRLIWSASKASEYLSGTPWAISNLPMGCLNANKSCCVMEMHSSLFAFMLSFSAVAQALSKSREYLVIINKKERVCKLPWFVYLQAIRRKQSQMERGVTSWKGCVIGCGLLSY